MFLNLAKHRSFTNQMYVYDQVSIFEISCSKFRNGYFRRFSSIF